MNRSVQGKERPVQRKDRPCHRPGQRAELSAPEDYEEERRAGNINFTGSFIHHGWRCFRVFRSLVAERAVVATRELLGRSMPKFRDIPRKLRKYAGVCRLIWQDVLCRIERAGRESREISRKMSAGSVAAAQAIHGFGNKSFNYLQKIRTNRTKT